MNTNIIPEYSDRVRYFLSNRNFGSIKIDDPIGWDEDDKEFTRNKGNDGIFTSISNALKFDGPAKEYIELVYDVEGINAELILTKEAKNELSDIWEIAYKGHLDPSTLEIEDDFISMKFNSGGLESLLKSREGIDVEIERRFSLDDKHLSKLTTNEILLTGRRIFLESSWKALRMANYKEISIQTAATTGATRSITNTFPFEIVNRSHQEANSTYEVQGGNDQIGELSMLLIRPVDRQRMFNVQISSLNFSGYGVHTSRVDSGFVMVALVKFRGNEFERVSNSEVVLWRTNFVSNQSIFSGTFDVVDFNGNVVLNEGEGLGLEVMLKADFEANWLGIGATSKRSYYYKLNSGQITIQEDSNFESTTCKAIKPFHLANRLVEILTNRKGAVKSSILENGKWSNLMLTHGFWLRGFSSENDQDLPAESRKFKPLTTNFKDFITSLSVVCNIGLGIEKIGAREYVVIEDLKYFYNRNTTIRLPNRVGNVKRSVDSSLFFQSINIGYEKGGDYEEAMGLDEFNTQNSYTTCIRRLDNVYSKLSKYRADSYGVEFARRKPFKSFSTEDTNYDQDIFFIDCIENPNSTYSPRYWREDFSSIPTGVFSPDTAFNLRLSPLNILLRHGWVIHTGLTKFFEQKIKYSSSKGNSNLKTELKENEDIPIAMLEKARYVPEIIEFDHVCTPSLIRQLEESVMVIGGEIKRCYGVVEFINDKGVIEKGFIMNIKPNGSGRWKVLKYNS